MDRRAFLGGVSGAAASAALPTLAGDSEPPVRRHDPVNLTVVEGAEGVDWANTCFVSLYRLDDGQWRMARSTFDPGA